MRTTDNPYELGPVSDARLLKTRRFEIELALDAVAPEEGRSQHTILYGEDRTGRTSTVNEVARRAEQTRGRFAITLRLDDHDLTTSGLMRSLLNAAVERLVSEYDVAPDWYMAWCDRMHLRDRTPMNVRDLLVSALAFAADGAAVIDPSVIARDLRTIGRMATERSRTGLVVCIDDADALLEDVALTERLVDALEFAGEWTLLLASRPAGITHLREAVSPFLRHAQRIALTPFWAPDQVRTCLSAPLEASGGARFMPDNADSLLADLVGLTSGNPFELALVARQLWYACALGEQEYYELTPRVLERFVSEMAMFCGDEAERLDGSLASRCLAPEQLIPALRLVACSRMTSREIAIVRLLIPPTSTDAIDDGFLTSDVDAEERRVIDQLEELQQIGLVSLTNDGRFTVQGGRAAELALKCEARSLLDTDPADQVFGMPFLPSVGLPLTHEAARRVAALVVGTRRLATLGLYNPTSLASGARLRSALMAQPFAGLDVDVAPIDGDAADAMVRMLIDPAEQAIVLVALTLAADGAEFDCVDVWQVEHDVESHDINGAPDVSVGVVSG